MTKPLSQGEKNRRANIRTLKAIGVKNAKLRAQRAAANAAEHAARNEDRRIQAIADKNERIAAGQAKRDAHNALLARDAERRRADALMVQDLEGAIEAVKNGAPLPIVTPNARLEIVAANDQMQLPIAI